MWRAFKRLFGWGLTWLVACAGLPGAGAEPNPSAGPSTFLYDVPEPCAARLADQWAANSRGWAPLAEDDTTHRFAGCAVAASDKIVAVFGKDTAQVDVYFRQEAGLRLCARLQPLGQGGVLLERTSLTIRENTRNSVAVEVGLDGRQGLSRHVTYELQTGAPFLKTTASGGVERLRVAAPCRFAVLPDFFGDDMLIDAAAIPAARAELPSENFLLHMLPGGDAMLLTVSESRDNDVEIALSGAAPREIISSEISYGKKPRVWIGILGGQGIWHEHSVALGDADKVIELAWKMPFPALWRVDWSTVDRLTDSWEMLLQQPDGKYAIQGWFGQEESEGQRFGAEFGDRDWNKPGRRRWNPVLGQFAFPCWVDNDGRAYLQPLKERRYVERGPVYPFVGPVVIYPLDRVPGPPLATPLERLTVVDLMRMTLGVGPCQYILDLEGQKRNSPGVATCYARDVINAIYQRGAQLQNRAVIEEHLALAVAFIRNVRERIDQYVRFGREMRDYLEAQKRLHPQHAAFLDEMLLVTRRLDQLFEEKRQRIHTPEYAQQTADRFRQSLLTYTGADAHAKCMAEMGIFTSIGGAQDGLVAACRMIVKTLRQRAGMAVAVHPELKDIAAEIRARSHAILRNPTAYEAPRH